MWQSLFVVLTFSLAIINVTRSSVQDGLVSTPWGKIRGVPKTASSGISITSFEGIPYAKPPLGNLRFSKPVPSTGSNTTILQANAVQPSCLMQNETRESEDCLYLDLYVPHSRNPQSSSPMAVMVFIHGGGFTLCTGDMNPEHLLDNNVIVAIVHYRLGAMGFLSTGDGVLKGNYGLWDQRMAIQWVKDNVAAFGGDPNSITIFGVSAGAASIAYHMLAPMGSKGLFKRAILQSGTATAYWALTRNPAQVTQDLAERLGCNISSSSAYLASCLRNVDAVLLQKEVFAQFTARFALKRILEFLFIPVVDHDYVVDEPLQLIKNSTYLQTVGAFDVDVIIGVLNNEAALDILFPLGDFPSPPKFGDYFEKVIIPYLLYHRYGVSTKEVERVVYNFYRNGSPSYLLNKSSVVDAFSDVKFVIPALEFVEALCKGTAAKSGQSYFYYFDYCPTKVPELCMIHGYDTIFEFTYVNSSLADKHVADIYVSLLTSFAKTGIPTANDTPTWCQFSPQSQCYLRISSQPENKNKLFPQRYELWTKTIPMLYINSFIQAPALR